MSQYDAMAAEYNATIQQLNDRLASAAIAMFNANEKIVALEQEIAKLKAPAEDAPSGEKAA
jgi:hypothetical protein